MICDVCGKTEQEQGYGTPNGWYLLMAIEYVPSFGDKKELHFHLHACSTQHAAQLLERILRAVTERIGGDCTNVYAEPKAEP